MKSFRLVITIILISGCAFNQAKKGENWATQKLQNMTIEEKVGQMMAPAFVPRFFNNDNEKFKRLSKLVKKYHIGGITFWRGPVYEVARSIERLQKAAKIPLLVMADMEWGLVHRVEESTRFLQNMATGATGNEQYAYEIGKITAMEARAMGIHVGYAPVMDVNNNPENIIINTRSYGEDPELVSRLGSAFIRGLQEHGVYATAKHYPGHGDTNMDSHINLPRISASWARIKNVELVPFKAAVKAGVKCIMVGHITFSDIEAMQNRPATLDSFFIQTVLRKELGFDGLVFTDAMEMGGITENYWSGEAAVMAINAGVDMLLVSPNFENTHAFIVEAVKEGRISMERINEAVRRILRAKSDLGLESKPVFSEEQLEEVLGNPRFALKAEEIANAAMTLVRDHRGAIPFHADTLNKVLILTITDQLESMFVGNSLNQEVMKRIPDAITANIDPRSNKKEIDQIMNLVDSVDAVIAGIFVKWGDRKGTISLPDTVVQNLKELFTIDKTMAVISFGSPYILRQIPEIPSYLCAYEASTLAVRAAIRAVFGEISLNAKLPVSIPEYYKMGDGLHRAIYKMELIKKIRDDIFEEAYAVLERAIADSIFPGAQVAIVQDGKLIASRGFGHLTYDHDAALVTTETIYDLASVTKVAATTLAAMNLWENKKIRLDIPIRSYLPKFKDGEKDSVTLRHLLTHSAGVHWWMDLWNKAKNKSDALNFIYQLPLDYSPGDSMIYSDLGLIMTGKILETVTGLPLDRLVRNTIYKPLGLKNTMFNPPKDLQYGIAPTEIGGGLNRGLIHGEVHDENAYFLGGVSAHAGLFSTAEDLAVIAQMLINGGIYCHHRFFSPNTVKCWTSRQKIPEWSARALGWRTPEDSGSSAGDYFSMGSFGHTGFTGTSIWIDPNRKIAIILLTNRVHPTRERGGMYRVRRDFHNTAMKALLGEMDEEIQ